jgi:thiamine-phosphate pyrophosphorylase
MSILSRLMVVTDRHRMRPHFEAALREALEAGARLIQLREKDLPDSQLLELATTAAALCREYGAVLLVNGPPEIALQAGAAGTHWPESKIGEAHATADRYPNLIQGASIHHATGIAETNGLSYLVFGSIYPTHSHPGAPPAGLDQLTQIAAATSLPLYAIGGITPDRIPACLSAGAHGIASIAAIWDNNDIATAIQEFLQQLEP